MNDSAGDALTASIIKEGVSDMAHDLAEIALDSVMDDGILKEIPFVSWLVRAHAIGKTVKEKLFLKKIALFLFEATRLAQTERDAFSKRLTEDPDLAESCGESLLLLIDKLSEVSKARLMGYAFRLFVQGRIDSVILYRIYAALELLPFWQFIDLPRYYFEDGISSLSQGSAAWYQQLSFVDVYYGDKEEHPAITFGSGESPVIAFHRPFYRTTLIGIKVAEVIRDYLAEPDMLQKS